MLTFFRHIRQSLLASGAIRKYILYAVGEVFLVMVGILLALQVNNWNAQKQENKKVNSYLTNLVEDLKDDQSMFSQMLGREVFRYYSLQYLYQLSGHPEFNVSDERKVYMPFDKNTIWEKPLPTEYNRDFVELTFAWSTRIGDREVNQSTLEEMKNTGIFSILNEGVKDSINNYYSQWRWRLGPNNYSYVKGLIEKWRESLMQEGIINVSPFENGDPIQVIREDTYKTAIISQMIQESAWRISGIGYLLPLSDRLVGILENETVKVEK